MVAHFGLDVVQAYMRHVQDNAEEAVRRLLSRLDDGHFRVETDQGTAVEVRITVDREERTAKVDFTGTQPAAEQTTSTRPSRSRAPPCSTPSASWSTSRSR